MRILGLLQEANLVAVALWIPRELNTIADVLSHFARALSRTSISGSSLAAAILDARRAAPKGSRCLDEPV